jgi:hypothetical protein
MGLSSFFGEKGGVVLCVLSPICSLSVWMQRALSSAMFISFLAVQTFSQSMAAVRHSPSVGCICIADIFGLFCWCMDGEEVVLHKREYRGAGGWVLVGGEESFK